MFNYVCVLRACISVIYTVLFVLFGEFKFIYKLADHFLYSCLLGILSPVTGCLSTYVQEPLAIGWRGEI